MSYAPIPMVPGPVALHEDVIAVLGRDYGSGQVESDFLCLYDATSRGIGKLMGTKDDVVLMTGEGMLALWGALKKLPETRRSCGQRRYRRLRGRHRRNGRILRLHRGKGVPPL